MKVSRSALVQGRGRLVGDHQLGFADQGARRRHPLLLADRQLRCGWCHSAARQADLRSSSARRALGRAGAGWRAARREAAAAAARCRAPLR
jgi:hypothetical protein